MGYIDPAIAYHDARITSHYGGLIFPRDITPTRPTDSALQRASTHVGL